MNYETRNHLMYNAQKPLRGMQYMPESDPNIRKKFNIPPLMQTRPVTAMTNSKRFMIQPQVISNTMQNASCQSGSGLNRNKQVSETFTNQQSFKINKFVPSTSKTEYFVDKRSSINTSMLLNNADRPVQENQSRMQRSTVTSAASSVAEFNITNRSNGIPNPTAENSDKNNFNFRIFGSTENEKMFIFTGTVERVIKWNKIFQNHFCYYEVIAYVVSIQEGAVNTQKIMLLRDKKGPILQVVYYNTTHIDIEDFYVGRVLRCLGRMSGPNILNAISIRNADQEEVETLQRHCLACDQAISHFLSV